MYVKFSLTFETKQRVSDFSEVPPTFYTEGEVEEGKWAGRECTKWRSEILGMHTMYSSSDVTLPVGFVQDFSFLFYKC